MKKNILKLSALLTIVTLSGALITAKDKTTTSKRQPQEQIKQKKELSKALKSDDVEQLKRFSRENPTFNWEGKYSNLIPTIEQATPLIAAAHFGSANCTNYLLQKRQVQDVAATDENGLTALDHAQQQSKTSGPKNAAKFNLTKQALTEAEFYDTEATPEIIEVDPVLHSSN